jgi:hypothetical protein
VPNKGESFDLEAFRPRAQGRGALDRQMVRYRACPAVTCGSYYSNVSRGKRKIHGKDNAIPSILESDGSSEEFRKNWARLIQKIYEVDPLACPKCSGEMKIINVIENEDVIKYNIMRPQFP